MLHGRIEGSTRVLGKGQGFNGLWIRDSEEEVLGVMSPIMESAWFPTPDELDALLKGAPVILKIVAAMHPPVLVSAGSPPEE